MANLRCIATCLLAFALACCLASCSPAAEQVPVRDAVNDYSWHELSEISGLIAQAPDEQAAMEVALRYHLAGEDGTLDGTQLKEITLADGAKTAAAIVGFRQDTRSDGAAAGISFVFAHAVAKRPMNHAAPDGGSELGDAYAIGGWSTSDLRQWLAGEFRASLPADLDSAIVEVEKAASAVPEFELGGVSDRETVDYGPDQVVTKTVDALWLPSVAEISGVSPSTRAATDRPGWTSVLRAEGSQYLMYAGADVREEDANSLLARADAASGKPCAWWLRSVENASFAYVGESGSIEREDAEDEEYHAPVDALGVVPGFCL